MPQAIPDPEKPSDFLELNAEASEAKQTTANAMDAGASKGSSAAEHTKSEVEKAADKLYEERMEEEYAKREGGA